ncbi:hypothetical protein C1886_22515 [Pseudomonas sp. FW300-N1A1]|nr:metallophosphoesterase [Pseudomonas sp. FW300-N1A1]POA17310.1 hypothetical protein C1886_22515 [Pseudomonas sp. FW300-N1A1]
MKIKIYSDLHLEFARFEPAPTDADLVILAGDIDIKSRGVKWANEVFGCPVIYVCGNHEFSSLLLSQLIGPGKSRDRRTSVSLRILASPCGMSA